MVVSPHMPSSSHRSYISPECIPCPPFTAANFGRHVNSLHQHTPWTSIPTTSGSCRRLHLLDAHTPPSSPHYQRLSASGPRPPPPPNCQPLLSNLGAAISETAATGGTSALRHDLLRGVVKASSTTHATTILSHGIMDESQGRGGQVAACGRPQGSGEMI